MISKGFTLLELLFVLSLIAFLFMLSYPYYQDHLIRARRLDAQTALLELSQNMEKYYAITKSYEKATLGTGNRETDVLHQNITAKGWYLLSIKFQTASDFTLEAMPIRAQAKDKFCQSFILKNTGLKTIGPGPLGKPEGKDRECWRGQ